MPRIIKNILVTGGAGFIGSAFIRLLLSPQMNFQGKIVNLDALTYAGNLENLAKESKDPRYFFQHGNICDEALLLKLVQYHHIDTIVHFAAESHVDRSIENPKAFLDTNIMGTFQLLEAVRKNPHIHFHHVSTDEVYGSLGKEGFFTENSPYRPNSPYSASKAASDHLVRAYAHTYEISTCISNCSNNYGPYQFPEKLIPVVILSCLERRPIPVYGEGLNVRDWLYVEDHASALELLLKEGKSGETYNIGGEAEKTNIELVHAIINEVAELTHTDPEALRLLITHVKDRPGHDLRYAIDCKKIKDELSWRPACNFNEGLKKTVSWYLANPTWIKHVQTGAYREWMALNYSHRMQ